MTDLTKFSKEDLKKTHAEIGKYLKKVDETSYEPRDTEIPVTIEEDDIGGTSKKPSIPKGEGTTEKSAIKKDDMPMMDYENGDNGNGDPTEQVTDAGIKDMLTQILEMLQELRANKAPAPPVPTTPTPDDQVQLSAVPPTPTATPSTTTSQDKKSDININVHKAIEEVLKGMGITPSAETPKPKINSGHPIEKTGDGDLTFAKIGKMSWDEIYNADMQIKERAGQTYF